MKAELTIKGLHCNGCATRITTKLHELGVEASVDFRTGKTTIIYNDSQLRLSRIKEAIKALGYAA